MVKNERIEVRISAECKRKLSNKAKDLGINLSQLIEKLGKEPFAFIEVEE